MTRLFLLNNLHSSKVTGLSKCFDSLIGFYNIPTQTSLLSPRRTLEYKTSITEADKRIEGIPIIWRIWGVRRNMWNELLVLNVTLSRS